MEIKVHQDDIPNFIYRTNNQFNVNYIIFGTSDYRLFNGSLRIYLYNLIYPNRTSLNIILKMKKLTQNSTTCECCRNKLFEQQCQNTMCRLYSPLKNN
jgi:hypothetical protein